MAGEPSELRCNGCADVLQPTTEAVVSHCNHVMCRTCAQKVLQGDEKCPLCQTVIRKGDVKLVTVLQPRHKCQLMMCGQTPEAIAESALVAMNFYVEQQRLSGMYENHKLKQKMEIIQTQCREKLVQMQHAYQQAKAKLVQTMQQRNALEQDVQELQQKYAQKASQTRKLQEMFKALQVEKEQLRRQYEELQQRTGMRNGGPAGGAAARAGLASRPSGHGSGRQVSLFQGSPVGTQMVTTVQHTRATFDLPSPAAGSGLNLLGGHGSAVVGPGNMFGTSGAGMGAGGQRPGTASGGMFAAAELANNRGSGGGGSALRLQGNHSLFGSPAGAFASL